MTEVQTPPVGTDEEKVTPPVTPDPDPEPVAAPPTDPTPPVDYEEKFKQSTRENQVLLAKIAEDQARKESLTPTPTDQELRAEYSDWDSMLPSEQQLARENITLKKTVDTQGQTLAEIQADKAWDKDLKKATKTYPQLKGRENEFEEFVFKPTHKGVSIDSLAKAFLYDATKDATPAPAADPPAGGIERGGTGRQERPKAKLLSAEELKTLRTTDSRAYKEYIQTHPEALDI